MSMTRSILSPILVLALGLSIGPEAQSATIQSADAMFVREWLAGTTDVEMGGPDSWLDPVRQFRRGNRPSPAFAPESTSRWIAVPERFAYDDASVSTLEGLITTGYEYDRPSNSLPFRRAADVTGSERVTPPSVPNAELNAAKVAGGTGPEKLCRIITEATPEGNLMSNAAKGFAPRGPELTNPAIHNGLSMFSTLEAAAAKVPLLQRGGKTVYGIAEFVPTPGMSVQKTLGPGHYTVTGATLESWIQSVTKW